MLSIMSWNTARLLEDCLASILTKPPTFHFEIWVVDTILYRYVIGD